VPAFPTDATDLATRLSPVPAGTAVSEVARRMLHLFTDGTVEPGTRLPPERQLAAGLRVGRSAVREALAALEILGIVEVRPGSGTYLRGSTSELLPQTLSWGLMLGERRTEDLLELRAELEVTAARLAAERMDKDQLKELDGHLGAMRESVDDLSAFIEADLRFHVCVAEGAGNVVLLNVLQSIRSLLRVWVERGVTDPDHARLATAEHAEVYAALSRGDAAAAGEAMSIHMVTATDRVAHADTERP
jgi:GntR family transcriptional repressor for pyruvate dehydrogenase complex